MNKKFRVWNYPDKQFIYPDKGYQGHYILTLSGKFLNLQTGEAERSHKVQQFIGILDKNMKEVYEEDVIKFKTSLKEDIGVVRYINQYCSYCVEVEEGFTLFKDILFDSIEIVGNMKEHYIYSEIGVLMTREDYEKSHS